MNKCSKDPTKDCPHVIKIGRTGGLSVQGLTSCCKIQDQIKSLNQAMIDAGPGVYGDIVITKEFHDQLKRNSK